MTGKLPESFAPFIAAHQTMVGQLHNQCPESSILKFSLDGKLLGDIGEWLAAHHYGMRVNGNNQKGFDGWIGNQKVEVKTTLRGAGVVFRYLEPEDRPDHLIVFLLSKDGGSFETVYNGPHEAAVANIYQRWNDGKPKKSSQCSISLNELREKRRSNR